MFYTEKEAKKEKNHELVLFIATIAVALFDLVVGIINLVTGLGTPLAPMNLFLGVLLLAFVVLLVSMLKMNWTRYQYWKAELEKIRKRDQ